MIIECWLRRVGIRAFCYSKNSLSVKRPFPVPSMRENDPVSCDIKYIWRDFGVNRHRMLAAWV